MIIGLFERCMKRRGVKEADPYDWEKVDTATVGNNAAANAPTTPAKNEYLHGNVTQMTVAASNASGIEFVCILPLCKTYDLHINSLSFQYFVDSKTQRH